MMNFNDLLSSFSEGFGQGSSFDFKQFQQKPIEEYSQITPEHWDLFTQSQASLPKRTPDEIRFLEEPLQDHEIVNIDTILGNTYFTYFDSTEKELNCKIRDGKVGDVRCMGFLGNKGNKVTIVTEDKTTFSITEKYPFMNLRFTKEGWIIAEKYIEPVQKKKKHASRY